MRFGRSKWMIGVVLAVGVFSGIFALLHDGPRTYDVGVRGGRWEAYARATPAHVVVRWQAYDDAFQLGGVPPLWNWRAFTLSSGIMDRRGEESDLRAEVAANPGSWRIGDVGFIVGSHSASVTSRYELIVPTWLACLAGITPVYLLVLARNRRRSRASHGQCLTCGYDLRATPGRCPECGADPRLATTAVEKPALGERR